MYIRKYKVLNMKNNKGFTLLELLGVIVVLAVIAVIVYPSIEKNLKDTREDLYNTQIQMIENSLEQWALVNRDELPTGDGEYVTVTLKQLVDEGFVDADVENPLTGKPFKESELNMVVTRYHNNYTYHVNP